MLCGCPLDRLCERCLESWFDQLRGAAACRGERWALLVANAGAGRGQPWPRTPKAHAIALRKVADLARDERLRERLAGELEEWAMRRWVAIGTNAPAVPE